MADSPLSSLKSRLVHVGQPARWGISKRQDMSNERNTTDEYIAMRASAPAVFNTYDAAMAAWLAAVRQYGEDSAQAKAACAEMNKALDVIGFDD